MENNSESELKESSQKLLHDLLQVVHDGEEVLRAGAGELGERSAAARAKLAAAVESAKDAARKLQDKAVVGAKATDKVIREHPYQSIGIAFCVGILVGVLINRKNNPVESEPQNTPGLLDQAKALGATGLEALQNRGELFMLELEEERARLLELLVWALAAGFLCMMFLALLTFAIVWMFPPDCRIWALGGFCVIYLLAAALAFLNLKSLLKSGPPPFGGSIKEMKKDREWLESLK